MNHCTNCVYRSGYKLDLCKHPANGVDPINGETKPVFCGVARGRLSGTCGPSGDLFEPVEHPIVVQPAITVVYQVWYIRLWNWIKGVFK